MSAVKVFSVWVCHEDAPVSVKASDRAASVQREAVLACAGRTCCGLGSEARGFGAGRGSFLTPASLL